jgi:4a-hydroxytetrahydrobiopterin dehydratase
MPLLDDAAVETALAELAGWERRGDEIVKTFTRRDFRTAMSLVNRVADVAESAGHHPDIDIRWNKVTLALSTHSQGGLTEADFALARQIEQVSAAD